MYNQKLSIPWQDYLRIGFAILMVILGPIMIYRSLKVPTVFGVIIGLMFFITGAYRLWLVYRVLHNQERK